MEGTIALGGVGKDVLAEELIRSFGRLRLRVAGSSMIPTIWPGEVVHVTRCDFVDAKLGDVVLYTRNGRLFVHRVVTLSGSRVVTRGDGIPASDAPVESSEYLGNVVAVERRGMPVPLWPKLTIPERMVAGFVRRSASAARILARLHHLRHQAGL